MATPETYILHGDDGRVYRIRADQLDQFEVKGAPAETPDVQKAVASARNAKVTARAAGALFACLIAARVQAPEDKSVSGGGSD